MAKKKIDYAKMFTKRKNGLYMGYWREIDKNGIPSGKRHSIYDRDPETLYKKILDLETPKGNQFSSVVEEWEKKHRESVKDRTWANYAPHVSEMKSIYGTTFIEEIVPADIDQDLLDLKSRGLSHTVVNTRRCIWRSIFSFAVAKRYILYSPAATIKNPKGLPKGKRRSLTDNEINVILQGANSTGFDFMPFFYLCTGVRLSEGLERTKDDINTTTWELNIPVAKTEKGIRTVPIIEPLREPLLLWMKTHPGKWLFPYISYNHRTGEHMTIYNWETAWAKYCQNHGFIDAEGKPSIGAHNVRHGTATLLFEAGVDVYTAQKILGHASITTTMEIYTELRKEKEKKSVNKYSRSIKKKLSSRSSNASTPRGVAVNH